MKYLFLLFLSFMTITSTAQYALSPADDVIALTKTLESSKQIVSMYIDAYKKKKPAPQEVWNTIAAEVDYTSFVREVKALYENNYSADELRRMAGHLRANQTEKFVQLSQRIEKDLYALSNSFGKNCCRYRNEVEARGVLNPACKDLTHDVL